MSDRALPYACAVANRVVDALAEQGDIALAGEVAVVNRATCDLVHALHREHEATNDGDQALARRERARAEAHLRTGLQGTDPADDQAAWEHLQALLRARPRHPGRRRHAGFFTQSDPA